MTARTEGSGGEVPQGDDPERAARQRQGGAALPARAAQGPHPRAAGGVRAVTGYTTLLLLKWLHSKRDGAGTSLPPPDRTVPYTLLSNLC